jgi:hypothetical protein
MSSERSGPRTRIMAFSSLVAFACTIAYTAREAYRAATDSFVAPIILSPDSDVVLTNKLKVAELQVERVRTRAQSDAIAADVEACDRAISRLGELQAIADKGLRWTTTVNARQVSTSVADIEMLARQRGVLRVMLDKQEALVKSAEANLEAGLVAKTDYARELQTLDQLRLALLENERTAVQSKLQMQQVALAQQSLAGRDAPPMPEMIMRQDQLVRLDLEVMRLESEKRSKLAERKVLEEKLAKLDELEAQLKSRPIFRAVEQRMEVAFVPYTQIDGVREGADVYDCIWGLVHCKPVGKVAEVVPGEVILPDPWGNQARGQYAVLDLVDHESAKSKTLRVRDGAGVPRANERPERLSAR